MDGSTDNRSGDVSSKGHHEDWILLNSQLSADVFCNQEFVTDIHDVGEILALTMNAGTLMTSSKATVSGYGKVWFAEHAITNVFSLALMEDRFQVMYDSWKESALIVHTPQGPVQFK